MSATIISDYRVFWPYGVYEIGQILSRVERGKFVKRKTKKSLDDNKITLTIPNVTESKNRRNNE